IPHNLLLLGRTVAILSGMCTGLDPDFNIWDQLVPYTKKLVVQEAGSNWDTWLDEMGEMARTLLTLPSQARHVLAQMERGGLSVQIPQASHQIGYLEKAVYRLTGGVIFAALLLSGTVLYSSGNELLGSIFLVVALITLTWAIFFARGHDPQH
ncbi:MAG: hypothetical protein MUP03_02670, partial [Anaerolineales bacterium]|nr:hypothetical protein [Anaerolineales bacterium]